MKTIFVHNFGNKIIHKFVRKTKINIINDFLKEEMKIFKNLLNIVETQINFRLDQNQHNYCQKQIIYLQTNNFQQTNVIIASNSPNRQSNKNTYS
jgi:hypothetical protein